MSAVTTQYDPLFKQYTTQWLPEWDWLYLKAQGYAESLLQADAVSPTGAVGVMQIEPTTWVDIKIRLRTIMPGTAAITNPEYNIMAGVYYMALMRNGWASPRSEDDRRKLAQASYNAGFGSLLDAQKLSGGKTDYASIIEKLPDVTGAANAAQTTTYVARIAQYYQQFSQEPQT